MPKVVYTQKGSDPATIKWPPNASQQWSLTSGVTLNIPELISYPSTGMLTYADGRAFPQISSQGSTITPQSG